MACVIYIFGNRLYKTRFGETKMLELYKPYVSDLWFRKNMLSDEQTMSYNHPYEGTIRFSEEYWMD